jgi:hypothetical protein
MTQGHFTMELTLKLTQRLRTAYCGLLILVAWYLAGCGKPTVEGYTYKSGDFPQFFLGEINKYGGHVQKHGSQELDMEWQYKEDENGVQMLFDPQNLPQFESFLKASLGNFTLKSDYPQIVYNTKSIGVNVFCNVATNPIHVICLRAGAL